MAIARIVVADAAGTIADVRGEATVGARTGCTVVLDDPIAAARHAAFEHDGADFVVRDLDTVSGTWLDGVRVAGATPLRDGGQIVVGATRAVARIESIDGTPTLTLTLQRNGFWWRKAGKKVFDNDPDALVRSEVGFGRFPLLAFGNRAAMFGAAALLLASVLLTSVLEPLSDPGPLSPPHAVVADASSTAAGAHARLQECRALTAAQGCAVCHEPGVGVTEAKCRQCHGDLAAPATKRHPYLGDGVLEQDVCVACHTDHQGAVVDGLKPGAADKTGKCEACHRPEEGIRARLDALALPPPPPRDVALAAHRFPHDAHVGKGMDCVVCHRIGDDRRVAFAQGLPDDPLARDFGAIPYETCRSCHVAGSAAVGITADDQQRWRATDKTWRIDWHGTDDGGGKCAQCHAPGDAPGRFGPAMKSTARPPQDPRQYAAQRASYVLAARKHEEQFAEHAGGKACTECHKNGVAARDGATPRTFWHALHLRLAPEQLASGAVAPAMSADASDGCRSCHQGLWTAKRLTDARTAAYHWPSSPAEQQACAECHVEGGTASPMQAAATTVRTSVDVADFPHDVHLAAAGFGVGGSLAQGCFACHGFAPGGDAPFQLTPTVLDGVADCTKCHTGHADIGGGSCQQCHPHDEARTTNSYLVSAGVPDGTVLRGRAATRVGAKSWPGANGFRHLSPGHDGVACKDCHDLAGTGAAKTLADVPIPDESLPSCRTCHIQKQFHFR